MFYVYEWYIVSTNEVIYVGKGCRNRYKVRKHNQFFNDMITRFECDSRIIKYFEKEEDAFAYEYDRVKELQSIGQCKCNIYKGGFGGETKTWTAEKRAIYSEKNGMHSTEQRQRMSKNNPMKNPEIAEKVNSRKRKPVIIDGIKYCSVKAGAEAIGVDISSLIYALKDGRKCKGHECKYDNQQPSHENTDKSIVEGSTTNS